MASSQPIVQQPTPPLSAAPRQQACGLAVTSLVLGVVGLCTCVLAPLLGIPAVICGHIGLSRIG
jgi:hypothetical protein